MTKQLSDSDLLDIANKMTSAYDTAAALSLAPADLAAAGAIVAGNLHHFAYGAGGIEHLRTACDAMEWQLMQDAAQ